VACKVYLKTKLLSLYIRLDTEMTQDIKQEEQEEIEVLKKAAQQKRSEPTFNHLQETWNSAGKEGGDCFAQFKLAIGYYFGKGVEKDYNETTKWLEAAAQERKRLIVLGKITLGMRLESIAKVALGICYYYGHGVEKNAKEASEYFRKSSQQNDNLGCLWSAYLTYLENKPVEEEIRLIGIVRRFQDRQDWQTNYLPTPEEKEKKDEINRRIKIENEVNKKKKEINEYLYKVAQNLFSQDNSYYFNDIYIDIINFVFSDEIICFLENQKSSPADVILGFYYQYKKDEEKSLDFFAKADKQDDIIASYELGLYHKKLRESDKAKEYFEKIGNDSVAKKNKEIYGADFYHELAIRAKNEELKIKNEELEVKNKELQKSKEELEEQRGDFEHSLRTPLNSIISSFNRKTDLKSCKQNAQIMLGMLELIKILSTDDVQLKADLISDKNGTGTISSVLVRVIDNILLYLLSVSGVVKIQQHYIAYAKEHGKIDCSVDSDAWEDEYFDLEQELQIEWEQEFSLLTEQHTSLKQRLDWIEKHFFTLNLIGFDNLNFQFRESLIKDSFFTILFTEILLNTFKYYSSKNKEPVFLEWTKQDNYQILSCRNPISTDVYRLSKGSRHGHKFMSELANKIGGKFLNSKLQDDFTVKFSIPNNILL
jgi:hypothetical protein